MVCLFEVKEPEVLKEPENMTTMKPEEETPEKMPEKKPKECLRNSGSRLMVPEKHKYQVVLLAPAGNDPLTTTSPSARRSRPSVRRTPWRPISSSACARTI